MEKSEQLERILLRMSVLKSKLDTSAKLIQQLSLENKSLKQQLESVKKTKFEEKKIIEIANMATQLKAESPNTQSLKRKLDKYIREVDWVIEALKEIE